MRYSAEFNAALLVVGIIAKAQTVLAFSLPLLAFELSGAGAGLALIKGAGFVPNILFAIVIGVINDRTLKATAFKGAKLAQPKVSDPRLSSGVISFRDI